MVPDVIKNLETLMARAVFSTEWYIYDKLFPKIVNDF